MKRHALIIGSSPIENPLDGVQKDVNMWQDYLTSLEGGAWFDNEITILPTPTLKDVKDTVKSMKGVDYSFISFSGHGYVVVNEFGFSETHLELYSGETISEIDLNPGSKRILLSLDCCRNISVVKSFSKSSENFSKIQESTSKINTYRQRFENQLSMCEEGLVKIYAASLNESASDESSFTQVLIRGARNTDRNLSISEAMEITKNYFEKNNPQQTPRYNGGRRRKHFPFKIK